jgi:DNA-binding transcriptional LysR family regulator
MIYSRPMLETFLAVCQHRNFTQAGNMLRKSQSCVSMQISQMEREVGLPLFDRAARPLTLTDAGVKFSEFAKLIVRTIDDCSGYMKDMAAGSAGELRIATFPALVNFLVSPVLVNVVKSFPNVSIQIVALGPPAAYEALRQGEIHFGVLLAESTPPEFLVTPIRSEPLYFVSSRKHPIALKQSIASVKNLRETPFVLGSSGHDYTVMIDQSLRRLGVDSYRVALRISNFEGMKKAVQSGIGLGILPRFAVYEELKKGTLKQVHVKGANFTAQMVLIESRKLFPMPTVQYVKKIFLKELANEEIGERNNPSDLRQTS